MRIGFCFFVSLICLSCNHPESAEYNRENRKPQNEQFISNEIDTKNQVDDNKQDINNQEYSTTFKVIGIKDGDTIDLLINDNTPQTIRFAHVDCPEKNQPFGKRAKQFVSDKCFGMYVSLIHNNKYDRNHRLIAEVILEDRTNLNKLLVENGLAWHYKKYSKDESYAELENLARQNQVGLWSDPNAIQPEVWRK
jgi:micrococcal nuclease